MPGASGSAYGTFSNTIASDGWYEESCVVRPGQGSLTSAAVARSSLNIHTSGGASNSTIIQAFAVGCLEAYFTHDLIYEYVSGGAKDWRN